MPPKSDIATTKPEVAFAELLAVRDVTYNHVHYLRQGGYALSAVCLSVC